MSLRRLLPYGCYAAVAKNSVIPACTGMTGRGDFSLASDTSGLGPDCVTSVALENEARQILVLRQVVESLIDVGGIDGQRAWTFAAGGKRNLFEQSFHHGV